MIIATTHLGIGIGMAALAMTTGIATTALAHAGLKTATPAANSVVKALPAFLKITFAEPIGRVTSVRMLDAKGKDHIQTAGIDPRNAARVLAKTTNSQPGTYRAMRKVVAADGHAQAGSFTFRIRT